MDIWNVDNPIIQSRGFVKFHNQLRLWRIDSCNFKVIEQGSYTSILTNPTYTLIKEKYSSLFQELTSQVEIIPVKIYDSVTKIETFDYVELKLKNIIDPNTINEQDSTGSRVWAFNGNLFLAN